MPETEANVTQEERQRAVDDAAQGAQEAQRAWQVVKDDLASRLESLLNRFPVDSPVADAIAHAREEVVGHR